MKNILTRKNFAAMLISVAAIMASADASACSFGCAMRHVGGALNSAGNAIAKDVNKGIKFASDTARRAASITRDEWNVVSRGVNTAVAESTAGVMTAYSASIDGVMSFLDDILLRMFQQAGRAFLSKAQGDVSTLQKNVENLSQQTREALKRVITAIPSKQISSEFKSDMQLIGKELGLMGGGMFSNIVNSSWGISVNGDVGLGLVGGSQSIALVLSVRPDNGVYHGAIVSSTGASLGVDAGAGASVGLFWQPGPANAGGLSIGLGMSAESAQTSGGGIGLSWGLPTNAASYTSLVNIASGAVPGISLGIAIPGTTVTEFKVSMDLNMGWSQVLATFDINPAEIVNWVATTATDGTKIWTKM